ncbi:PAS domain S-box protein [Halieaceae bacterium IMCC11814]|uniref:histidine kinase n=1 Tax=Candidatus Marimicrobium litorale TaxID=2518991 RepID=A0ABT3T6A2_9GAMM|nr:PAS domain S-box protein [Candidatus Marimicrobium litorale]
MRDPAQNFCILQRQRMVLSRPTSSGKSHLRGAMPLSSIRTTSIRGIALLFAVLLAFLAIRVWVSEESNNAAQWVTHTQEVEKTLRGLLSIIQDAETGQRGYLLTTDTAYLEPYYAARSDIFDEIKQLQTITKEKPLIQENIATLSALAAEKLDELGRTVELHRQGQKKQALAIVKSDKGKLLMDRIRVVIDSMEQREGTLLKERKLYLSQVTRVARIAEIIVFIIFSGVALTVLIQIGRALRSRQLAESKLIENEERTRLILDAAGQGICGIDPQGCIVFANRQACNLLGYTAEELLGTHMHSLLRHSRPDDSTYPKNESPILNAPEHNRTAEVSTEMLCRRDGTSFPVEYVSTSIRDNDKTIGAVVLFSDTTERKRLEEQLRRSQKLEAIGQLSGGIAHDFNNLLGVMMGNAEMLEIELKSGGDPLKFTDGIMKAIEKAASLTQRLLAFSRQQPLSPKPTDIADVIISMEDMLRRTLGATVDLRLDCTEAVHAMVDQGQLENAILNLALNARDAMPSGGVLTIQAHLKTLDEAHTKDHENTEPGEYVEIVVSDTGFGMAPDVVGNIFEPFYTTKKFGEGSGLGLSMVYGFVKQSGGHITVVSEPDIGTSVKVYLRRSLETAESSPKLETEKQLPRGTGRVLVVEDETALREISVETLVSAGYDVVEAEDGIAALRHLESGAGFDLLFTDLILPGAIMGHDIAKRAKEIQSDIKVLYTTGFAENTLTRAGTLQPSAAILHKPYRRKELLESVGVALSDDGYNRSTL